ncbi:MAG: hypothetical protein U1C12_00830 [Patescibacteria group bacterium]|nr:hypothetical protein [Patescibacteria group bacterium]
MCWQCEGIIQKPKLQSAGKRNADRARAKVEPLPVAEHAVRFEVVKRDKAGEIAVRTRRQQEINITKPALQCC